MLLRISHVAVSVFSILLLLSSGNKAVSENFTSPFLLDNAPDVRDTHEDDVKRKSLEITLGVSGVARSVGEEILKCAPPATHAPADNNSTCGGGGPSSPLDVASRVIPQAILMNVSLSYCHRAGRCSDAHNSVRIYSSKNSPRAVVSRGARRAP